MNRSVDYAIIVFTTCLLTATSATATLVINVGDVLLLENTPNQVVPILVSGGDPVQGLNFNLQVADGGPAEAGTISGPAISAVDLTGPGTIFDANFTRQSDDPLNTPQLFISTTTTNAGVVAADGVLALVTFDTTGFFFGSGHFDLSLRNTLNGATDFAGLPATITDGQISIAAIPEPSALLFVLFAAVFCVALRRRRTRRVRCG